MHQGKFVLSQIMEFLPKYQFDKCVDKHQGDYRTKTLSCWNQFLAMTFGQLSHRESLRDIVNCLSSQKENLYHLGFSGKVSKSTLAEANEKRSWEIYGDLAQILIREARELYFDDCEFSLELEGACYVIDSSVIALCLNLFPWARLKTIKAAIKLNMQLDLKGNIPVLFSITNARNHDLKFLDIIDFETEAYYILDRGYVKFTKLYQINQSGAYFVIRAQRDLGFKRLYSNSVNKFNGIRCDQIIKLNKGRSRKKYPEKLRRIKIYDNETNRYFVFLTNDFNISAETVADLYKNRWQIELFFKWIKQHLKIKSFWGYSENAVKTQICIAICIYLLVAIVKKKLKIDKDLYQILQILNVTLLTKSPLKKLLSETKIGYNSNKCPDQACLWDFLTGH